MNIIIGKIFNMSYNENYDKKINERLKYYIIIGFILILVIFILDLLNIIQIA